MYLFFHIFNGKSVSPLCYDCVQTPTRPFKSLLFMLLKRMLRKEFIMHKTYQFEIYRKPIMNDTDLQICEVLSSGDKNISILHLSSRTSELQFPLALQTPALVLVKVYTIKNIRVLNICNMTFLSNSSQSTRPVGRVLWEELLVLSRFHS